MTEKIQLSKVEKSLLLYLETRAVDYGGLVDISRMNEEDMSIAEQWNKSSFIKFGRVKIQYHNRDGTHWCKLSPEAFRLAHAERIARCERIWLSKKWLPTEDSIE